jgi:hypothetical protein
MTIVRFAPVLSSLFCATAGSGPTGIEIRGGQEPENAHAYSYSVINYENSPVVAVDLPHFRGDVFRTPPGWTFEATERFVRMDLRAGRFVARASSEQAGIAKGHEGTFSVRVAHLGAARGRGTALVTLRDGRTFNLEVECAVSESFVERHAALIGMVVVSSVFILFSLWRSHRKKSAQVTRT